MKLGTPPVWLELMTDKEQVLVLYPNPNPNPNPGDGFSSMLELQQVRNEKLVWTFESRSNYGGKIDSLCFGVGQQRETDLGVLREGILKSGAVFPS